MTAEHKPTPNRKPGRPVAEPTKPVMLRLTQTQNDKYLELGGARWVKRLIDEALSLPAAAVSEAAGLGEWSEPK